MPFLEGRNIPCLAGTSWYGMVYVWYNAVCVICFATKIHLMLACLRMGTVLYACGGVWCACGVVYI